MSTNPFCVNGFRDLQVMQRVFREAKFCNEPNDLEVSSSPIVADLYQQLLDALINAHVERDGERAREGWMQWLQMTPNRDEWQAAMRRAKTCEHWLKWTTEERLKHIRVLLSPFSLSQELEQEFMIEVGKHREGITKEGKTEN